MLPSLPVCWREGNMQNFFPRAAISAMLRWSLGLLVFFSLEKGSRWNYVSLEFGVIFLSNFFFLMLSDQLSTLAKKKSLVNSFVLKVLWVTLLPPGFQILFLNSGTWRSVRVAVLQQELLWVKNMFLCVLLSGWGCFLTQSFSEIFAKDCDILWSLLLQD